MIDGLSAIVCARGAGVLDVVVPGVGAGDEERGGARQQEVARESGHLVSWAATRMLLNCEGDHVFPGKAFLYDTFCGVCCQLTVSTFVW
jgi:hypothetical protein